MGIDEKTKSVLMGKLNFTPVHIDRLEKNADLLSKTLGLLQMARQSPDKKESKQFIQKRLKKIRELLSKAPFPYHKLLQKARAEYYTFQRFAD
ncbi:MAG: hypothetical protein GY866_37185 [Proteobacteria bacterium]|nr:hypothetical protein [Pseudomonadota bacterium]